MPSRFLAFIALTWAALAGLNPAVAAETVFPPGLRIGLEPPVDLRPSTRFPGFEDRDRKAGITIFDLPAGAYPELERAAAAKDLESLTVVKRETFSFHGGAGTLIAGRAKIKDVDVHKWVLLASAHADQDLTMLVNVEVPDSELSVYSDAVVRKTLASITFRPTPIQEQLGLLPFKLDQLADFRVMKVLANRGVLLTTGPTDDLSKQDFMIVSIGRGSPDSPDDRGRFARKLLAAAPVRDLDVQSAEAMRVGGGPGYEIRAQAKAPNGDPIMMAQWLRFSSGSFLSIAGFAHKGEWDALFTRFRAVRDGIELR
jgi:hypothetical protein